LHTATTKNRFRFILLYIAAAVFFSFSYFFLAQPALALIEASQQNADQYTIVIYIDEKKLYLLEGDECIRQYSIASGKSGYPSPIGQWKITSKGKWGEGFGGRWMGLNVPWGRYGIHGTTREGSIGSNASHGCIRMFRKDAKELYDLVPVGTKVIILNGSFGPFGNGFRSLKPGDRGADVYAVQQRLKALGYYNGSETGIYRDDLKYALHKFQKDRGLTVKDSITTTDYNAMGFVEFE